MQEQPLVQLLGPPGGWISRLEGVPKVSCRALFKVLEGPWASWGVVCAVFGSPWSLCGPPGSLKGVIGNSWELPWRPPGGSQELPSALLGASGGLLRALGGPWEPSGPSCGLKVELWQPQNRVMRDSQERVPDKYTKYMFYL